MHTQIFRFHSNFFEYTIDIWVMQSLTHSSSIKKEYFHTQSVFKPRVLLPKGELLKFQTKYYKEIIRGDCQSVEDSIFKFLSQAIHTLYKNKNMHINTIHI
jgi:hypothetical protein